MDRKHCSEVMGLCSMLVVVALMLLFSGCAQLYGPGDYSEYASAIKSHSESENTRITNQAKATSEMGTKAMLQAKTPAEAALQAAIATMVIGNLHPVSLDIKKPTTGMDVASSLVGQIPIMAVVGGMYRLGKVGIESAGNISIGDNAQVEGFNRLENHATGSTATATASGTAPPAEVVVVDPVVVQPAVAQ